MIISISAFVFLLLVWAVFFRKGGGPVYNVETPRRVTLVEKVEASGTINPVAQTSVGTQVSGIVKEIYVDFNSRVKKGQLLALIDPSTYESAVLQQKANLQKAQSVATNSKRNYERYKKLYAQELVAKSELDDAQTDYDSAYAQTVQARAALDKAKIDLGYTKVVSPVNGIVISREVDAGQTVAASFQTPTLFLVAEDLTKMQIEVNISEADISKIKEGQKVEFSVDAYSNDTFIGKVKQVRNSATTVSNVVTYTVVVAVDNSDFKLKPGMTANVSIITNESQDALSVPNQALRFVPPTGAEIKGAKDAKAGRYKGQGLWVEDGSEIERIEVKTGITDGTRTQIISDVITDKTPVIVSSGGKDSKNSQRRMGPPGF